MWIHGSLRGGRGAGRDGSIPPRTPATCPPWCISGSRPTTRRCSGDGRKAEGGAPLMRATTTRLTRRASRLRPAKDRAGAPGPPTEGSVIGRPAEARAALYRRLQFPGIAPPRYHRRQRHRHAGWRASGRTYRTSRSLLGILFGEELQYRGRDTAYEDALKMAVEVLNRLP